MKFKITETTNYGVMLSTDDEVFADKLDDFLSEDVYVLYDLKSRPGSYEFYFGLASSLSSVENIVMQFEKIVDINNQ